MKTFFKQHSSVLATLLGLVALMCNVSYASIGLTLINQPGFGLTLSGASGRNFVLNTSSSISGTHSSDYVSGAIAGQLTVTDDSSPASISIRINNVATFGGLSVNQVLCSYNNGTQMQCDGSGMSATSTSSASLKIGIDITTSHAHSGGSTASASMDVNVVYL